MLLLYLSSVVSPSFRGYGFLQPICLVFAKQIDFDNAEVFIIMKRNELIIKDIDIIYIFFSYNTMLITD